MLDLIMDLRKARPMYARPFVMGSVVSEVASEVVEEGVEVVPARIVVVRRVLASMMLVRNPGSMREGEKTGKQNHEYGIRRVEVERKTNDRPEWQLHPQKHAEIFRISAADPEYVDLMA